MLGSKTRQVASYGRRGHRIVNVDDNHGRANVKNASVSLSQHRTDDSVETPRKAQRGVCSDRSAASSPELSSPELNLRTKPAAMKADNPPVTKRAKSDAHARKPLSMVPANVPSGTARAPRESHAKKPVQKKLKPRVTPGRGTPARIPLPLKPISPVVDVEIITLDDAGKQVGIEKRRTNLTVPSNLVPRNVTQAMKAKQPPSKPSRQFADNAIEISSDDDYVPPARTQKSAPGRRRAVILSDEDSDIEVLTSLQPKSKQPPSPKLPPPRLPSLAKHRRNIVLSSPESVPSASSSQDTIRPSSPKIPAAKPTRTSLEHQPSKTAKPAALRPSIHAPRQSSAQSSHLSLGSEPAGKPKPRPLTPIRSRAGFPAPASPPSPTTPSETSTELSFDFAELALSPNTIRTIEAEATSLEWDAPKQPAYLRPLLEECGQDAPHEFSAFIEMFPLDPIVQTSHDGVNIQASSGTRAAFRKIGEASYSEVFGIGDVVLKIVPLRNEEPAKKGRPTVDDFECPAPSDAKDVLKEVIVTQAMGELCSGFVELLRTYIVRGRYPSLLLDLWDEYHKRKGSESVRPDGFAVSQIYAIIVLPNGGPDLETYTFSSSKSCWRQACSLFWQVTRALAEAEDLVEFEHRDLHWGQILVKDVEGDAAGIPRPKKGKTPMDVYGARATIIDLGLSRMNSDGRDKAAVHWTPFDEETFEGEGDYQFDVYRMMRAHSEDEWKAYRPLTNVMWLHYLVDKLLHSKRLRKPYTSKAAKPTRTSLDPRVFSEHECHACLVEVEAVLKEAMDAVRVSKKARRKTQAAPKLLPPPSSGPSCAGDVLQMAHERGWLS